MLLADIVIENVVDVVVRWSWDVSRSQKLLLKTTRVDKCCWGYLQIRKHAVGKYEDRKCCHDSFSDNCLTTCRACYGNACLTTTALAKGVVNAGWT